MAKRTVTRIRTKVRDAVPNDGAVADAADRSAFSPLHWMAAGLFLATGAEAVASRRLASEMGGPRRSPWRVLGLAPLVVAPLAGVAHVLEAAWPERGPARAVKVLDGVAVGVAVAATAAGVYGALAGRRDPRWYRRGRGRRTSILDAVAPLAVGATGVLGLLLEREAREAAELRRRLEKRARLLDRLIPRRRAKIDRIVVHV
jgi:hypothetical protein